MNEEDIKILKQIKEIFIHLKNYGWINDIKRDIDTDKAIQSIENLINRNKELEEENEIYKEELEKIDKVLNLEAGRAAPYRYEIIESLQRGITQLKKIIDNSIPVSLVEETIEELNRKIKYEDNEKVIIWLHKQRKILQELLEK